MSKQPRYVSVIRIRRGDYEFVVGPWASRLIFSRSGSFSWLSTDGWLTRKIRRFWSGWYRWQDDDG